MTLTGFLKKNRESGPARFYMPGHKGRLSLDPAFDITEIAGADSLYHAAGAIRQTERRFERLYGSRTTVLSAGGTTLCIQGMLAAAKRKYGVRRILAGRNVHVSFLNACALLDLEPVWIWPTPRDRFGVGGTILPEELEEALRREAADAVYLTSPDYFGLCSEIRALAAVCEKHGVPLLVDNAHGAHLKFLPEDRHPLSQGAALCCDGAHKTLPVLTGGALLHAAADFTADELKSAMALFGSTSPSYLILQSLDACADWLEGEGPAALAAFADRTERLRETAREAGWFVFDSEPLHLSVAGFPKGFDGDCAAYFRAQGVECDYAAGEAAVLLPTPFNTEEELALLERALSAYVPERAPTAVPADPPPRPERAVSLREASLAPARTVPVEAALGRIAAESRIVCPPGVAVVAAGEKIDAESQKLLKKSGISALKVL